MAQQFTGHEAALAYMTFEHHFRPESMLWFYVFTSYI